MDYEKRYNELIDAIKEMMEANPHDEGLQNWVHDNVPELAESEDEKIRKALIELVKYSKKSCFEILKDKSFNIVSMDAMLAWLEKQDEQKPFDYENATMTQKDFAPNGMTDSQYLDRAVCYIEEREKDDDYICNKLYGIKPEREICCKDCQGLLDRTCVLRFLKYYKKGGKE